MVSADVKRGGGKMSGKSAEKMREAAAQEASRKVILTLVVGRAPHHENSLNR